MIHVDKCCNNNGVFNLERSHYCIWWSFILLFAKYDVGVGCEFEYMIVDYTNTQWETNTSFSCMIIIRHAEVSTLTCMPKFSFTIDARVFLRRRGRPKQGGEKKISKQKGESRNLHILLVGNGVRYSRRIRGVTCSSCHWQCSGLWPAPQAECQGVRR